MSIMDIIGWTLTYTMGVLLIPLLIFAIFLLYKMAWSLIKSDFL